MPASCCLSLISAYWGGPTFSVEEVIPEKQGSADLLVSSSLQDNLPWGSFRQIPEKAKVCSFPVWVMILLFALLPPLMIAVLGWHLLKQLLSISESLLSNCKLWCLVSLTFQKKIIFRKIVLELSLTKFQGFASNKSLPDFLKTACVPLPYFSSSLTVLAKNVRLRP